MSLWKKKRPRASTWTVDDEPDSPIENPNFQQNSEKILETGEIEGRDNGVMNPNFDKGQGETDEPEENGPIQNGLENPNFDNDSLKQSNKDITIPHEISEIEEEKMWKEELRKAVTVFTIEGKNI